MKTKTRRRYLATLAVALAMVLPPFIAQASSGEATGNRAATNLPRFSFGTSTSVTRRGFTKVAIGDAFSSEKGFGFKSIQGLLAYDRGGAEIMAPKDKYTDRTYGAYRTTSDLTGVFLTEPELPSCQELKTEPTNPPLEWTAAEQQRGCLVFPVDCTEPITPVFAPARTAVGKPHTG